MTDSASERLAIGIDVGGTKVETALVGVDGHVVHSVRIPTDAAKGVEHVILGIEQAVQTCRKQASGDVCAVGIGLAGQVDEDTGRVFYAPNLDWRDLMLGQRLHRRLGLPVQITNDVRAAAWGEWHYGAGRGSEDLVCVFVGTGVGGAIVSGGRMLKGASHSAGELGHTRLVYGGRACSCGGQGCLEAYCGGWAIAERAQEAVCAEPDAGAVLRLRAGEDTAISAELVSDLAHEGDPLARHLMDETVAYLSAGMASVLNAFNPARVILGGGVIEGSPGMVETIARQACAQALETPARVATFAKAALGGDAGVIGAAALARQRAG